MDTARPHDPSLPREEPAYPGIRVEGVSHAYAGRSAALRNVSLTVEKGKVTALVGLSGCGKSTVAGLLMRFFDPASGKIYLEGRDYLSFAPEELRRHILMVPQSVSLFSGTIAENLRIAKPDATEAEMLEALEQVRLKDFVLRQEKGLDADVGDAGAKLSGGQRQKIGIARALANDPEVLLMDEPFSALDPIVRREIQFEFLQIQRKLNKTVLFITHDIDEAFKLGDTVAIMRDGRIIQVDTPEEMSANPADDYVRAFIEGADRSQVLTAKNIMTVPTCLIRARNDPAGAIREMSHGNLSSAYVVDDRMRLVGVIPMDAALKCLRDKTPLSEAIEREPVTTTEDTLLSDIIPLAAGTRYPIAVVDPDGVLKGIVSRAAVLSSLV